MGNLVRENSVMLGGMFVGFIGVVEDINDPLKQDRVKVRIHGVHTDQTVLSDSDGKGIPPADLPWARVLRPTTGATIAGFGMNHGLLESSWVFGMSMDGEAFNDLLILGSIPGVPEDLNPNPSSPPKAFFGQDGYWPDEEFLNEPDVSRLARGDLTYKSDIWKPIPIIKVDEAINGIPTAAGATWNEKPPEFSPTYPWNQVRESPARHTEEWDSTPGKERITLWHGASHSYQDWHQNGDRMVKVTGDDYEIVLKDRNLYVKGTLNITAKGAVNILAESDCNIASIGNCSIEAMKGVQIQALGAIEVFSISSVSISALGSCAIEALGSANISASGDVNVGALGKATVQAIGDVSVNAGGMATVAAVGEVAITAGGAISLTAGGLVTFTSPGVLNILATTMISLESIALVNIVAPVINLVGEVNLD